MTSKTKKNGMPRAPKTREEIRRSIREFGKTMSDGPEVKTAPAAGQAPALNPCVFQIDPETARLWAIVQAAH